ncbi:hypothetical protein ER308_20950 [Egibacter rhizosphaerae]|uniref:Uncharacterized protein n=1 Tax=Egibacter rhizosphaerae TaxID=1670831 RepID=A0A411YKS7_9ACTN|nr:hypothetical protein [Egibacter rhizosphaerae]QBI21781.1 hypothetical protein ER308_20950 [Egibacter rhizosphaerae]
MSDESHGWQDATEPMPSQGPQGEEAPRPAWWKRRPVLLPVTALVALIVGASLGGDEEVLEADLQEARAAAVSLEERAEAETERADEAEQDLAEAEDRIAEAEDRVSELEGDLADAADRAEAAERDADDALDAARDELENERDEMLADAESEADEIVGEAEDRVAELDDRESELDDRESELAQAEERETMTTFGNGVHVVGEEIEPGTYRTDGPDGSNPAGCYWERMSGLGGDASDRITNGLVSGPTTVEISGSDAGFESASCSEWSIVE